MKLIDEKELLDALKNGSKLAFEQLYKTQMPLLWHEAYRIMGDQQTADDAVQELFIELWEKKQFGKIESNIRAYLFTCIRRKCYKLQTRKRTFEEIDPAMENTIPYEETYDQTTDVNKRIAEAMAEMSPQSSKVFELYVLEDKKRKEVALELGLSDNTVKSYLATAIKIARKKLLMFKKNTPI
uniref:RNA polymerase sigma factor n=1 Tax=Pedobacter schmidteae TaxID=2201271 RepID=UPI000EB3AC82|nr:sigma-70 family RNA polymerase sigma factor [Pedobacter schmidteae]